ncbi:uncharacterized protein KD926_000772 [Aspergillus affinis]|uniref:uncharacterized protein n=1 Tax=Aspergillus affinis TaxID=1070780 RepID=UPI0022FE928E|nr:uncharacterized protein KD926_000772 [Aspergillus affinis]KAI9037198.1 hypothetical protein KD926_000772 [Aspergillus affinis]
MSWVYNPLHVKTDWKKTVSSETGLGLDIYVQFLQLVTGGLLLSPEVNVEHSNKTANTFAFDIVTTLAFEPTQEYVKEAVKAPAVQIWLREPRQKFALVSELFVVTGMKLVKGAKIKYSTSQSTMVKGNLGIDINALGTIFRPKGHWTSTNDDATESNRESEFVFVFRVKRLKFGRKLKLKEYNKGAFMTAVPDMTENGNVYCVFV